MIFTTQHKDRVLQLGNYIQKTKQNKIQAKLYMHTKSITNQLVIRENGQRGTINNAQASPLDAGSTHNFYYHYIITSLQTT